MNKFIKLIIVTDGSRFRAFRFSARRQGDDLYFHCAEIPGTRSGGPPATGGCGDQPANLEMLAERIVGVVSHERPELWNLVAPQEVADELARLLCDEACERLTRTVSDDMINVSLAEVVLRFPPVPCTGTRPVPRHHGPHGDGRLAVA